MKINNEKNLIWNLDKSKKAKISQIFWKSVLSFSVFKRAMLCTKAGSREGKTNFSQRFYDTETSLVCNFKSLALHFSAVHIKTYYREN